MAERHGVTRVALAAISLITPGVTMTIHFLPPAMDRYDAAVEEAIANSNGDAHGAVKALIIANEFLERELKKLYALRRRGLSDR